MKIIQLNELTWQAKIEVKKIDLYTENEYKTIFETIALFEYVKDSNQKYWLSSCCVNENYQRKKIGQRMILAAIKEYKEVYFSNTDRLTFKNKYTDSSYDSRHLTPDGEKFVKGLIENNIIPNCWYKFPEIIN